MGAFKIIMSLVISGLIGYCTNYIAVKMLFRPRTVKHIFGHRVPFTPGIIPKNQPRLAKALGNAVSEKLLTGDDLREALTSEKTASAAADAAVGTVFTEKPVSELLTGLTGEENAAAVREFAERKITAVAVEKLREADVASIIISEGTAAVKERVAGSMLAMFVNDELIASLAAPLGDRINEYIDRNAEETIGNAVKGELDRLEASSPAELLSSAGVSPDAVREAAARLFRSAAVKAAEPLLATVDIPKLVEDRVNAMSVEEVEDLVMSVMKHELNAVISLGALIGVIIGLLNILVQNL